MVGNVFLLGLFVICCSVVLLSVRLMNFVLNLFIWYGLV